MGPVREGHYVAKSRQGGQMLRHIFVLIMALFFLGQSCASVAYDPRLMAGERKQELGLAEAESIICQALMKSDSFSHESRSLASAVVSRSALDIVFNDSGEIRKCSFKFSVNESRIVMEFQGKYTIGDDFWKCDMHWHDKATAPFVEVLQEVYRDGKLVKEYDFAEVRANSNK